MDLIEEHFPPHGKCGFCCDSDCDGRHRLLDAIVSRALGGDSIRLLSLDYGRPIEAIEAVLNDRTLCWFAPERPIRRKPRGRGCRVIRLDTAGFPHKALVKDLGHAVWVNLTTLGKKWKNSGHLSGASSLAGG